MRQNSKAMLLAVALLCTFTATNAQYNRTWDYGKAIDIVDIGNGHVTTLATDPKADIILAELDFFGNIMFRTYNNLTLGRSDEYFRPTKMVYTPNGEYLVVGIYSYLRGRIGIDYAPFAARFDAAGNLMWVNVYDASSSPCKPMPQDYARTNVVYVEDDPNNESYIITTPSDPHDPMTSYLFSNDIVIHGLRIDALGAPIWNKKYRLNTYDRQNTWPYTTYYSTESYPQALTYYAEGTGAGRYFIGGTNVIYVNYGMSTGTFFMSIDRNGAIDHAYSRMNESSTGASFAAWDNDAIFDAATQEVVMVSTAGNWSWSGSSASAIYVTRFSNSLSINSCDFYHDPTNFTENYVRDISLDASGNNYVIAAWVYDQVLGVGSAAMLKIDKITMTPVFYNRFNISHSTNSAAIVCHTDAGGVIERYTMHGYTEPSTINPRIFSTDINGDDFCNPNALTPSQATLSFNTPSDPFEVINVSGTIGVSAWYPQLLTSIYFCGTDYKKDPGTQTSIGEIDSRPSIELYPSIISAASESITLSINSEEASDIVFTLYNAEGKLIYQKNSQVGAGNNQFTWIQEFASPGLYFLKVNSDIPELNQTFRLTRE